MEVLKEKKVDVSLSRSIIEELQKIDANAKAANEDGLPKTKKKFLFLTFDDNSLSSGISPFGYVIQVDEDYPSTRLVDSIKSACDEQFNSRRNTKTSTNSLKSNIALLKRKYSKEHGFHLKSRYLVEIVITHDKV